MANKKNMTFMSNVESSRSMAGVLKELGTKNNYFSGGNEKDDSRNILHKFARVEITHLDSCAIFLEGFDEPSEE